MLSSVGSFATQIVPLWCACVASCLYQGMADGYNVRWG